MITKDTTIDELVNDVAGAVKYLMDKGIRCIICGEPIWGTLEEAAIEKGFGEEEIAIFVKELNELAANPPAEEKPLVDKKIETKKYGDAEKEG